MAAENRSAHDRFLADAGVRPDDRMLDDRVLLDVAVSPDHAVRADAGAGLDDRALVHETGTLDDGAVFDARVRRHPRGGRGGRKRCRMVPAVHDVAMYLHVLFSRADVDPVPAVDVRDERLATLAQRGKV